MPTADWAARAAAAERAVRSRHVQRALALPGTAVAVLSWPPSPRHRLFLGWNYWWQAHLLDCLTDAQLRDPQPDRKQLIGRVARGIRLLNAGRWRNDYYDDMAWLALALERADRHIGTDHRRAIRRLTGEILLAWSEAEGGGIPWRRGDEFKNTPANGPAAILLARTGQLDRAVLAADWIDRRLRDPATGLIWDGLRPGPVTATGQPTTVFETTIYTYCQGVVLGAELELLGRLRSAHPESAGRLRRLVAAVDRHLTIDGVLTGHQGGDSGLFTGVLARYLTAVAAELPGATAADRQLRSRATEMIMTSASAAWSNALLIHDLPVFGPDWTAPAVNPAAGGPERDLSVQLSGWMLMEAAAALAGRPTDPLPQDVG
ncbi:MAG: glycoside hydrolase family 76 protein [Nakamurella sp.]